MEGFDFGFALELGFGGEFENRAAHRPGLIGDERVLVGLVEGRDFLLGELHFGICLVVFEFHIGGGDGLENAVDGVDFGLADRGRGLDDFRDRFKAQRVADDLFELALGESARGELFGDERGVFRGVELTFRLKNRDFLDAVGHLVIGRFDAEFARLVLENEKVPDELRDRHALIGESAAEFLQEIELPERTGEVVVFDLAFDCCGVQLFAVDAWIAHGCQFIQLSGVVEKNKRHNCDEGDEKHQAALVFPENLNHKKSVKI